MAYNNKRGYRNNNPLNIRISKADWQGKVPAAKNTDGAFEQFETMAYGFRAALKLLRSYVEKHNCKTLQDCISRWAPGSDGNNPVNYANTVAKIAKITPDTLMQPYNEAFMVEVVFGMAFVENGAYPLREDIRKGWQMI